MCKDRVLLLVSYYVQYNSYSKCEQRAKEFLNGHLDKLRNSAKNNFASCIPKKLFYLN